MRSHLQILCLLLSLATLLATQTGCLTDSSALRWPYPSLAHPHFLNLRQDPLEAQYKLAAELHKDEHPNCVDAYFQCLQMASCSPPNNCQTEDRRQEIHRSALINFLQTAQDHQRYVPGVGIRLCQTNLFVPIESIGFTWPDEDFHQLHPVGKYRNPRLPIRYQQAGVGITLVVQRHAETLQTIYADHQSFAATAIFESDRILLINPLQLNRLPTVAQPAIVSDLTAPFAHTIQDRDRIAALNFIYPQRSAARPHLFMAQPYEPGKIPVVLVHGLAADHTTWTELANYLNACPSFRDNYQLWYFQYPTGVPFLSSAAELRQQLEKLCNQLDPEMQDPALFQIKLVGHSMGGLISKLQATDCCDEMWQKVCRVPIEGLVAPDSVKQRLISWFRFSASPRVAQTILIATPHKGAPIAASAIGKVSAKLVNEPEEIEEKLEQLIFNNPGAFFDELQKGYPTSIDLLDTGDQVLSGIQSLRYQPNVSIESIYGTGKRILGHGAADGVVPVASALEPASHSQTPIGSTHTAILSDPQLHELVWHLITKPSKESGRSFFIPAKQLDSDAEDESVAPAQLFQN